MTALSKIRKSGFDVTLIDGYIEISPSSKLTPKQRDYLKAHKAGIIAELQAEALPAIEGEMLAGSKPPKMQVLEGEGTHLGAFVTHGDTWEHFEDAQYRDAEPEPEINTYPKPVTVWTPIGEAMQVMAKSREHEQFLINMNPKPKQPNNNSRSDLDGCTTCGNCTHFTTHHAHGKGSGFCKAGVMPSGVAHWSETEHECDQFKQLEATPC
jgi:hypothetical protein